MGRGLDNILKQRDLISSLSRNSTELKLQNHQFAEDDLLQLRDAEGFVKRRTLTLSTIIFQKLQNLRFLVLSDTHISNPQPKHLRCLDLSCNELDEFPKQLQHLSSLQVLLLTFHSLLHRLPEELNELLSLTYLDIGTKTLGGLPSKMRKLRNVEVRDSFSVGKDEGYKFEELRNAKSLTKIHNLGLTRDRAEANVVMLSDKPRVETLVLKCKSAATNAEKALEGLQPHSKFNVLKVRNYGGQRFPILLTPQTCQLVSIYLDNCPNCQVLPSLGQLPLLKNLVLRSFHNVTCLDEMFIDQGERAFQRLESLEFHNMTRLVDWTILKAGDMPSLYALKIIGCPMLLTLPSFTHLSCLMFLEINHCPKLQSLPEVPSSLNGELGELIIINSLLKEKCQDVEADQAVVGYIPYLNDETEVVNRMSSQPLASNKDLVQVPINEHQLPTFDKLVKKNNVSQGVGVGDPSSRSKPNLCLPRLEFQSQCPAADSELSSRRLAYASSRLQCLLSLHWRVLCVCLLYVFLWLGYYEKIPVPFPIQEFQCIGYSILLAVLFARSSQVRDTMYWLGVQMLRVKAHGCLRHAKGILFLFGESHEFEKDKLIQLWMAGGSIKNEPMEENGANYFEKLISDGYILPCDSNGLYRVNSEKLNSDLELVRNKSSFLRLESASQSNAVSAETLHIAVVGDEFSDMVFKTLRRHKLKTLLFLGDFGPKLQEMPRDLFHEFLVALDLSGTRIKELPSSAGRMISLRYLDLSWTFLELLPEWINRFQELQTLRLKGCFGLRRLPNSMEKLIKLRHLDLDVLGQVAPFPKGMGALVNLRTLSAFAVGTVEGLKITELEKLNYLTGEFCIAKLENVGSMNEAKKASLTAKANIKSLELRWSDCESGKLKNDDKDILESLRPHSNLEELQIVCYRGPCLPSWIYDVSFKKLVSITLFRCEHVFILHSLEKLPALEGLELTSLNSVTKMDYTGKRSRDHVAFPRLLKLAVDEMLNLQTWTAHEADYPCLVELRIKDCPKLSELPSFIHLPSIKHLKLSGCANLAFASDKHLASSLQQLIVEDCPFIEERCSEGGEDWHKIQHVPTIWIDHMEDDDES